MQSIHLKKSLRTTGMALLLSSLAAGYAHADNDGLTGHVDVYSKYILRGITQTYSNHYDQSGPESDGPALQGGVDWNSSGGWYLGYWFSTLGYSYETCCAPNNPKTQNSTENDFYGGYNGKIGDWGYTLGETTYYYTPGYESTGYETKLGISYGDFGLTAQTLLKDVTYGNAGDTYYVASYSKVLPKDFTFSTQLGFYTYKKDGDYVGCTPKKGAALTGSCEEKSSAFRHLTLGVSKPIGTSGATWGLSYIIGGENRFGLHQTNQLVGNLTVAF